MYMFIKLNYKMLHDLYCKNKNVIKNGYTSEDIFHQKLIEYAETDINNPSIEGLKIFFKSYKKNHKTVKIIDLTVNQNRFKNNAIKTVEDFAGLEEEQYIIDKIKYLFIDYRYQKKKKTIKQLNDK